MEEEADIRYRVICGSLIFATFSAVGMGVGLYTGRLIRKYIRYNNLYKNFFVPRCLFKFVQCLCYCVLYYVFMFYIMCYSVLPIPVLTYCSRLMTNNKDLLTYLLNITLVKTKRDSRDIWVEVPGLLRYQTHNLIDTNWVFIRLSQKHTNQSRYTNCLPKLTLSPPIPLRLYTLPYRSKQPFLISDIWALWRSGLSAQMSEIKNGGLERYGAGPFEQSNLEQLALKGLISISPVTTQLSNIKSFYSIK